MRSLVCVLLMILLPGCLVTIDDGFLPDVGPGHDGGADGEPGDASDAGPQLDAYYPFEHAPEDCPEEAARARRQCDPRCDGVSHFYCAERPGDACCRCLGLGQGGGSGGGGSGQGGSGQGGGGGGLPPIPPPPR